MYELELQQTNGIVKNYDPNKTFSDYKHKAIDNYIGLEFYQTSGAVRIYSDGELIKDSSYFSKLKKRQSLEFRQLLGENLAYQDLYSALKINNKYSYTTKEKNVYQEELLIEELEPTFQDITYKRVLTDNTIDIDANVKKVSIANL